MKKKYELLKSVKRNLFFPENYPDSVKSTYLGYMKYNILLQFSSSALGVLSTQQLLISLGMGSLTASAALNWVLKDGLGQLGGILYAGTTGSRFDENPKFYKWISATSLNLSCFVELLSPLCPSYFLLLASAATMGKNISAMSGSASRAAIHLHFCKENNLADLTAKSATQTVAACLAGTFFGTYCGYFASDLWVSTGFFSVFSLVHLYSCYKGLDYIQLNTLNPQRMDILLKEFERTGRIASVEEVSKVEAVLKPYRPQGIVVGTHKVFTEFENCEKFVLAKEAGCVHLIYEETAEAYDVIRGYIKARELGWGVDFTEMSVKAIEESGWDVSSPFLARNSTRIRFI